MNRNAHILFLASIAFAAFGLSVGAEVRTTLIAAGLFAAAGVATVVFERRTTPAPARVAAGAPVAAKSNLQTKRLLMLMMAIGIVVYGGGAGTFSSFSAETSNTNSTIASGTLTMSDAVTGGQTCFSNSGITNDNINDLPAQQTLNAQNTTTALGACDTIATISNIAPGTFAGNASVTIANTGSIDASKFKLFAPYVNTALATGTNVPIAPSTNLATTFPSGIPILPLAGPVKSGDSIELDYGGSSYTATAAQNTDPLSTTLKLTGTTPVGVTFAAGTRITDTSTDGQTAGPVQQNIECFDVRNASGISGGTAGTSLNFNGTDVDANHWVVDPLHTYTGPLCANLGFWIQEQSVVNGSTYNYCWYGDGSPLGLGTHPTTNGMCRAPIGASFSGTPPASLPTGAATLTVTLASPLKGNVMNGDGIKISELGKSAITCSEASGAANDEYINATQLVLTNCSAAAPATGGAFTAAAVITDTTTVTDLATDTQTLSNWETLHGAGAPLELTSLVGNGSLSTTGATVNSVELGKAGAVGSVAAGPPAIGSSGATRKFYIGVYLQTNTATAQNAFQGLKTTFGLGWHIDQ